ncbi:hypothetical protein DUI87_11540 [Hirundo rustica rustica]|uniref:Uncharacterized protein n=1 Tax=Hirundo rustica rustica TaxID=333673 RepID=A0A3M0KFQ3_HIRRU|nr:hypothetical protein DUI87_11540 [Hirundo rustica rustica]
MLSYSVLDANVVDVEKRRNPSKHYAWVNDEQVQALDKNEELQHSQVVTAGLEKAGFTLPVMVLHGLGLERMFLQVGRQEAKRGKRREKEDDCEKRELLICSQKIGSGSGEVTSLY